MSVALTLQRIREQRARWEQHMQAHVETSDTPSPKSRAAINSVLDAAYTELERQHQAPRFKPHQNPHAALMCRCDRPMDNDGTCIRCGRNTPDE